MSSRGLLTTFNNKYLPLEISPENYWQHWWFLGDAGAGRLTGGYEKKNHHGSRCLDGNVESVM